MTKVYVFPGQGSQRKGMGAQLFKVFQAELWEVYAETRNHYLTIMPGEIAKAELNPRHKMALVFRW